MKAIKIVGIILLVLVAVVFIVIYMLPNKAHMERQIVIKATPSKVYKELVTYRNFTKWSPWADKAPGATYTYSGPEFGVGARINWESDHADMGDGSMEILLVEKNKRVVSAMKFDGYESTPRATIVLNEVPEGTLVTWAYDEEEVSGLSKLFMLGIDGFLGGDFERGLQKLKERVERMPDFSFDIGLDYVQAFEYLGIRDSSLNEPGIISTKMAINYGLISEYVGQHQMEVVGEPLALFINEGDFDVTFVSGLPVESVDTVMSSIIKQYRQDSTLAIKGRYVGDYSELGKAHEEIKKFTAFHGYTITDHPWESYSSSESAVPDSSVFETCIFYPVR